MPKESRLQGTASRRVSASFVLLIGTILLAGCGGGRVAETTSPSNIECAPYARQISGMALYGDAADWWDGAAGRYARGVQPSEGAVLVFRRSDRLPHGHVSVVTSAEGGRAIRVTQANWVHHRVARDEPVTDVSTANDWSAVRVWWAPAGQLGSTVYPTYGFVGPAGSGLRTSMQ